MHDNGVLFQNKAKSTEFYYIYINFDETGVYNWKYTYVNFDNWYFRGILIHNFITTSGWDIEF
jgi:hypothetical protein